jgi:hypothetical protein
MMLLRNFAAPFLLVPALLAAACARPVIHQDGSIDSPPPSQGSQSGDHNVLAGEWEYIDADGAVEHVTLDGEGNGRYKWKDGRFETHAFIGHTWQGMWYQKENNRDGGFTVEFSPDFSEGEGRWWYSRIGTDHAPTLKGGTFHLRKKTSRKNHSETPRPRGKRLTP